MNKKIIAIIFVFILLFLDIYLFFNYIYVRFKNKSELENNEVIQYSEISQSEFKINKIILFSSASGINKNTNFEQTHWILDIFEYTDIAIYFDKPQTLTSNNTIKTLSISNIKFNTANKKYTPALYYLDANKFGTDITSPEYKIQETLDFTVLNFDNKDNSIMYNTPIFFSDLSNPITLKFTNTLLPNHPLENTENIIFDGSLLSKTPLTLNNLKASLSLDINVTNYNNENYITNLNIEIPLEIDNQNIFNGSVYQVQNINLPLLKIKK